MVSWITLDDKMLHYFLCYLLVPRFSNNSPIMDIEIRLIYVIKNNIQINWSYVILHHMEAHNENSVGLPYARFLIKVFKKCNVNITNEKCIKMTKSQYLISKNNINGKIWVRYDHTCQTVTYLDEWTDELCSPPPPAQHQEGVVTEN